MQFKVFKLTAILSLASLLFAGCDSAVKHENATLKNEVANLQQRLQDIRAEAATNKVSIERIRAEFDQQNSVFLKTKEELSASKLQLEMLRVNLDKLTKDLSEETKAKEKAEKALESYRDKTSAAYRELKALRGIFDEKSVKLVDFNQNYLTAKREVTKLVDAMPESSVKRRIFAIVESFSEIKTVWEKSIEDMENRQAQGKIEILGWNTVGGVGKNSVEKVEGEGKIRIKVIEDMGAIAKSRADKVANLKTDIDRQLQELREVSRDDAL